jgi:two-component system C4-dicarboxylate transport sensor histidine kinase DctB
MHGKNVVVEGAGGAFANVDEGQLQQVLLNLVQNAGQAGAANVTLRVEGSSVHVVDDGPGVAANMREQLFLPFATNKQRGTGLGLAASRRIARDNGGDLAYVDGGVGAGGHFVLTLEKIV